MCLYTGWSSVCWNIGGGLSEMKEPAMVTTVGVTRGTDTIEAAENLLKQSEDNDLVSDNSY